jgi:hypothetical protein
MAELLDRYQEEPDAGQVRQQAARSFRYKRSTDPPIQLHDPNRCSMLTYPTTKLRTPLSDLDGVLTYASRACASQ